MKITVRFLSVTALLATLAACGNKGALVHPQPPMDDMAVPATTMPAPASTAPAVPADTGLPVPASSAPAVPAEAPPPANGGG